MDLDDIKAILALVREHDLSELELERDGLKIRIKKAGHDVVLAAPSVQMVQPTSVPVLAAAAPAAGSAASAPAAAAEAPAGEGVDFAVIKSPIVGTFYRSPEPGARSFVEVGDHVKKGQVLCIIEAMKLMNEIESDCEGEVVSIYVENGQSVQFGDRLFAVKVV